MANIDLKTDFKDGDVLHSSELNSNFKLIKEALKSSGEGGNVIWQDTTKVHFKRLLTDDIDRMSILDGALIYDIEKGRHYIDYKNKRILIGSAGNEVVVGDTSKITEDTKLIIETDEMSSLGTEVVNTLLGDEPNFAPSVQAVNKKFSGLLDVFYPINSVYVTSKNQDPSLELGGTWQLIDKQFKSLRDSDTDSGKYFSKNDSNVANYNIYFTRKGSTITMRIAIVTKVEISDDKVILGNLLYEALGLSRVYFTAYSHLGATDGGNAVVQCNLTYDTGELSAIDVIHKTAGSNVAVGSELYFEFTLNAPMEFMLDDACDKFYWERIA